MSELKAPKGKVIIKRDEPESVTKSGIILGKNDKGFSTTGVVVAGNEEFPSGASVVFQARSSNSFNFKGDNLIMIVEEDVVAVL